jgi:peptidyl-dipeptidase Dcp
MPDLSLPRFCCIAAFLCVLSISAAHAAAPHRKAGANPLAQVSSLPYGLPQFALIRDSDFTPAFSAGMAEQLREVRSVADNPAAPTFANTLVALERSGAMLGRVSKVFFNLTVSNGNPALQALEQEITPRLAAHADAIQLDPRLFARIEALYAQRESLGLDPESRQLLERDHISFVRAGALLGDADKARLRHINEQLASASTRFRQNVLKATQEGAVAVDDRAQLEGLSDAEIAATAEASHARGMSSGYLLTLRNTTVQPVLASLRNRALRERVYRASAERATQGASDNRPVIAEIMRLRCERAKLLGYATPADYVLEDDTAGTPAAVNRILAEIAPVAMAAARREAAEIQALIDAQAVRGEGPAFQLQPWDWDFYAEQVRRVHHDFDAEQVKPYFELDHVLIDGAFHAAHQLFGLTFRERHDLQAYRDDVRIFEVSDADGSRLGLFLADYFARDNKQGGAWMNTYVDQSDLLNSKPVVVNNLNLAKPALGQPVLLSFDEVTTLFHEFGHALHGLLSKVRYASLSGINVPPDFGEFPSQYYEMWAREPAVLAHFARHYRTGAALPKALFDKVLAAQKFNQGFATTSYLAAALLDQSWHQIGLAEVPDADHVMAFEEAALRKAGMDFGPVPVRYRSPYFIHVFNDGYEAGYYAYLWSEVLARDTGLWLHRHGGLNRANGDFLRAKILSRGRTREPGALFEEFYGGPPESGPLLEYRGLAPQ